MRVVIASFGPYLWYRANSAQTVLDALPSRPGLIKRTLPVGYLKRAICAPLRGHPGVYLILSMWEGSYPKIETRVRNEYVTLKNPLLRAGAAGLSRLFALAGKSLRTKRPIPQSAQIVLPIRPGKQHWLPMMAPIPHAVRFARSRDAGNFVCNYAMWVVREEIQARRIKTRFYMIHVPLKCTENMRQKVLRAIEALIRTQ